MNINALKTFIGSLVCEYMYIKSVAINKFISRILVPRQSPSPNDWPLSAESQKITDAAQTLLHKQR